MNWSCGAVPTDRCIATTTKNARRGATAWMLTVGLTWQTQAQSVE
jgi:hypothetical protein